MSPSFSLLHPCYSNHDISWAISLWVCGHYHGGYIPPRDKCHRVSHFYTHAIASMIQLMLSSPTIYHGIALGIRQNIISHSMMDPRIYHSAIVCRPHITGCIMMIGAPLQRTPINRHLHVLPITAARVSFHSLHGYFKCDCLWSIRRCFPYALLCKLLNVMA